jgi:KDO2-lipid IV(A) lauroyltransferase
MSAMEWLAIGRIEDAIGSRVTLSGREHIDAARAAGKGVVWITGHVGTWELMALAVRLAGYPVSVIATQVRYAAVNRLTIDERAKRGIHTIERESASAGKDLLRRFRANELIGFLADHDTKVPSVQVDFFGKPAWTAVGPAELSIKLQAPALSGFIVREGPGRWRVEIGPPIFPPAGVPKADTLRVARDLTQQYTRRIEDHVRAHPEDWAWMHKRWRP